MAFMKVRARVRDHKGQLIVKIVYVIISLFLSWIIHPHINPVVDIVGRLDNTNGKYLIVFPANAKP